ncbi:carbohydrate kinase family protein [Hoyosella altamirensis]|uniref:Fructokinase n=1 Tax=Hoyosella altamirensis TaxID=616997 RepID=A0A839RJ29_9ACTN|nr:carbohydrate kinase [Hoyosella altamirensis]MBB3036675.1 fructokinase [Hoyosella altamirensis]
MPFGHEDLNSYALVIGESLIDIVSRPGQDVSAAEHVGGSPCNVAVGLSRLGRQVEFATQFAADRHGEMIRSHLEASGVGTTFVSPAARTSTAKALLDENGAARYEFDIHWDIAAIATPHVPVLIHTGSIATFLEPGAEAVAATLAGASSVISFDPNVRPGLITNPARARERIDLFVSSADVVKASDEDLEWYAPGVPPEDVVRDWLSRGPSVVVVTKGKEGALGACRDGEVEIAPHKVDVIDTVGAGDAFMTGILDSLWSRDMLDGRLAAITCDELAGVLNDAAAVSALTVARAGADLPTRAARDAYVAARA